MKKNSGVNGYDLFGYIVLGVIILILFGCVIGIFCSRNKRVRYENFQTCEPENNLDDPNFRNQRFFKYDNVSVTLIDGSEKSSGSTKVIPPYGVDAGNTFGGPIQQSSQGYMYFPTGKTEERGRGRGFYMLGYFGTPSASSGSRIDYINIQSMGNSIRFGDLTVNRYTLGAGSNSTRGLFTGGYQDGLSPDTDVNAIEFITIATLGDALDFGDLVEAKDMGGGGAWSNGVIGGGMGGFKSDGNNSTIIEYITISTTGNASTFGDLFESKHNIASASNSVRAIGAGGSPSTVDTIQFIKVTGMVLIIQITSGIKMR